MPTRRLFLRDLIPTIPVSSTPVEYPRQTVRTNAAAPVEEGTLKPESGYQWQLTDVPIRTIAHWVQASRQILSDAPQLSGLIDTELLYGLMLAEEAQFLTGSGVDQNIHGIIPQATAYAAPFAVTDETMIDRIGLAILQQDLTDLPADGVALHPSDWMRMRLIKNADGEYILGDPGADVEPRIFGRPVVATQAMTVDKFLTGSFQLAATIYDREQSRIEASTEDRDNFVKNLVTVLAEERVGLAVKRTPGFTYGDFGNVA
jgi:HK97 family phage major capsid protein